MVKWINSWVQGIIIAVIISTIIEMILPEGSIKKYVRTVIGTYIVFVIVSPIISKITGKEINLKMFELPETENYKTTTINTNAYIESTYINSIKQEIIKSIEENGYTVKSIDVEIDQTEEKYGNINKISIKLKEKLEDNDIKPIEINIKNNVQEEEKFNEKEIKDLKEFLQENYGTKLENIKIE